MVFLQAILRENVNFLTNFHYLGICIWVFGYLGFTIWVWYLGLGFLVFVPTLEGTFWHYRNERPFSESRGLKNDAPL